MLNKMKTLEELKSLVAKARQEGKKVVFTNGVYDLLHIGQIRCLEKAHTLGDILIVAVNSDSSVKQNKGDMHPIIQEKERAEVLSSLACVDFVIIFPSKEVTPLLEALHPEVFCKGGDYALEKKTADTHRSVLNQEERALVESYGGTIALLDIGTSQSTSKIIKRICDIYSSTNR